MIRIYCGPHDEADCKRCIRAGQMKPKLSVRASDRRRMQDDGGDPDLDVPSPFELCDCMECGGWFGDDMREFLDRIAIGSFRQPGPFVGKL